MSSWRDIPVGEYLAMDRAAEVRSEYHDGQLFPLEAISISHSTIALNTGALLKSKLAGSGCRVFVPTPRVRVSPTKFVYPDLMIVCGTPRADR